MAEEESTGERLDRELMELLQELRVVITGVQILLAFLLTAPFQQRFAQLQGSLRNAFFASIVCATLATACLLAPTAQHRLRWRARDKERLVRVGNQLAIIGSVFLAAAIVLAVYVVTNVLFTSDLAIMTAVAFVVVFAGLWYIMPMAWRSPSSEESSDEEGSPDEQPQESREASSRR
jgi:Kef-type K+ transport system membrane component KefB